jgi:hypothetical protein
LIKNFLDEFIVTFQGTTLYLSKAESRELQKEYEALRKKRHEVDYPLFPDEDGHGLARPENRLAFYAAAEQFLARHLGGHAEAPTPEEELRLRESRQ